MWGVSETRFYLKLGCGDRNSTLNSGVRIAMLPFPGGVGIPISPYSGVLESELGKGTCWNRAFSGGGGGVAEKNGMSH